MEAIGLIPVMTIVITMAAIDFFCKCRSAEPGGVLWLQNTFRNQKSKP